MNLADIFSVVILLLSIGFFIVSYILFREYRHSPFHSLYVRLFASLGVFFLMMHLIAASGSADEAWLWTYFLVVAHLFYPLINDSLVQLSGIRLFGGRPVTKFLLLYTPFLLLMVIDLVFPTLTIGVPELTPYGWVYTNLIDSPVFILHQGIYFVNIIFMVCLVAHILISKTDRETRTYITFFILTFFLPFVLYITLSFLFDSSNRYIIPFTASGGALSMVFIVFFLTRHRVFDISPEIAAHDIIANMTNLLFLTNKEFKIQQTNQSVQDILGYDKTDMLGQYFYEYVYLDEGELIEFFDLSGNELQLLSKKGNPVPVLINVIPVYRKKFLYGYAILGLDWPTVRAKRDHKQLLEWHLKALQSQMNPHFVYNAAFSVREMIENGNSEQAMEYLNDFGRMYRQVLNAISRDSISIKDEVKLLNDYLSLEKINFRKNFTFLIEVNGDASVYDLNIPPMLIQPLVENAIKHGFEKSSQQQDNQVVVSFGKESGSLKVLIEDNGIGRKHASLKNRAISDQGGHGIRNIRERIDILNTQENSLRILFKPADKVDSHGKALGTTVSLVFSWQ